MTMDWLTALAIVTIAAGVTISVVVLVAVGSIRRSLNENGARQAQHIRALRDTIATLTRQQEDADARIHALLEANRRMTEELAALGERVADTDGGRRSGGAPRMLH